MSIYTRKGDHGKTRLFTGEPVDKDDLRVQVYGTFDELQAHLGLARAFMTDEELRQVVFAIQNDISCACAELASNPETFSRLKRRIGAAEAADLEARVDALVGLYGLPKGFIVPGRAPDSAAVHVARTVCRRGERLLVMLNRDLPEFDQLLVYFNRLSDFLFVLGWSLEVMGLVENTVRDVLSEGVK